MKITDFVSECTAYDFKLKLEEKKPKSWLKSVSAFANGIGGSLLFGVDNDGSIKGLDDIQHVCEAVSTKIRDYMDQVTTHHTIISVTGSVLHLCVSVMRVCQQRLNIWYDWFLKAQIRRTIHLLQITSKKTTLLLS